VAVRERGVEEALSGEVAREALAFAKTVVDELVLLREPADAHLFGRTVRAANLGKSLHVSAVGRDTAVAHRLGDAIIGERNLERDDRVPVQLFRFDIGHVFQEAIVVSSALGSATARATSVAVAAERRTRRKTFRTA